MKKLSVLIPVFNQEVLIKRAIESIPQRNDVEIIVCDDGSTDQTAQVIQNTFPQVTLLRNPTNKGVGYTVNRLLDCVKGDYIVLLGSDDYFYTDALNRMIDTFLYSPESYDLIYFNLKINNGTIYHVNESNKYHYCGSVKFMKSDFIQSVRCPELRCAEDYVFFVELMKKSPKEYFTDEVVKHYNFPRKGSLIHQALYS